MLRRSPAHPQSGPEDAPAPRGSAQPAGSGHSRRAFLRVALGGTSAALLAACAPAAVPQAPAPTATPAAAKPTAPPAATTAPAAATTAPAAASPAASPAAKPATTPAASPAASPVAKPAASPAASPAAAAAPVTGPAPVAKPSTPLVPEVVVDLAANPQSMHPYLVSQIDGWSVMHSLFNYLVERDFEGKLVPALAESFSTPNDRTIEFKLRRGVKFHNGEDFNADSVIFSIQHIQDPDLKSPSAGNYGVVDRVERVDDFTVRVLLKQPAPYIFDAMSQQLAMLPPKYVQQVGANGFAQKPVGTGPYRFVEFRPDDRAVIEANPDYWGGLPTGWATASRVIFRPVTEPSTRVADLRAGTANLARAVPEDSAKAIEAERGRLKVVRTNVPRVTFVLANTLSGQFKDVRARRALNYAINKDAILQSIQGGQGEIVGSAFTSVTQGRNSNVKPYPYDPARARQLLQEAGLQTPLNVTLDYATLENRELVEAVAGQLREVGINASIQGFELTVFNNNWREKKVGDLRFFSWGPIFDPWSLSTFVVRTGGPLSVFSDPDMDRLIDQSSNILDVAQRDRALGQLEQKMSDDPWGIYLFTLAAVYGVDEKVPNFRPRPDDYILLTTGR